MAVDVHVVTPEREVWTGSVDLVIARGVDGEVGILAGHSPMLVQLAIGALKLVPEEGEPLFAVIDGGFLHVSTGEDGTRVDVMASHAELADEIDLAAARRRMEEAERRLADRDDGLAEAEISAARADLQKAAARINLAGD